MTTKWSLILLNRGEKVTKINIPEIGAKTAPPAFAQGTVTNYQIEFEPDLLSVGLHTAVDMTKRKRVTNLSESPNADPSSKKIKGVSAIIEDISANQTGRASSLRKTVAHVVEVSSYTSLTNFLRAKALDHGVELNTLGQCNR